MPLGGHTAHKQLPKVKLHHGGKKKGSGWEEGGVQPIYK